MNMMPNGRPLKKTCVFIGSGQMANALIGGFISSGLIRPDEMTSVDPNPVRLQVISTSFPGVHVTSSAVNAVQNQPDLILICVKPDVVPNILEILSTCLTPYSLVVSIAAGVSISTIESQLPHQTRVIRIMPNTPCLVRHAASAIAKGSHATSDDFDLVFNLMSSAGVVISVPESKLDAVTGLSGSGPAFVFAMIEALADGGVASGLSRSDAQLLAAQTVLGAAKMVLETGQHPGVLKDQVASPAGTTIAGLVALEEKGFRGAVIRAVMAASCRAKELSRLAESS